MNLMRKRQCDRVIFTYAIHEFVQQRKEPSLKVFEWALEGGATLLLDEIA